jgi:hypothetical protein
MFKIINGRFMIKVAIPNDPRFLNSEFLSFLKNSPRQIKINRITGKNFVNVPNAKNIPESI